MSLDEWARTNDVVAIYFHGSRAEGLAQPESDADIGVFFANPPEDWEKRQILAEELAQLLSSGLGVPATQVDVQILNGAPPAFQYRVVQNHHILWEANDSHRCHFETRLMSEYLDYRYYEDIHHQARLNRIREGNFGYRSAFSQPTSAGA